MASFELVLALLYCCSLLLSVSTHDFTRWKGGAGIWHDSNKPEPQMSGSSIRIRRSNEENQLSVSKTVIKNREIIAVNWSSPGIQPNISFVGVYCPSSASDNDYIDHFSLSSSSGSRMIGPLVNMRCNFEFRLFGDEKTKLATSETVVFFGGPNEPLQGRLALTNRADEMRVMWVSGSQETPVVQFLEVRSNTDVPYALLVIGTSSTYAADDMCGPPATNIDARHFRDPGFIHDVLLTGLLPRTQYRYRFGDGGKWSDWFTFTSSPQVGHPDSQVNMFAFGDLGEWRDVIDPPEGDRSYTTMWRIENDWNTSSIDYNILLHVGDLSYAKGHGYLWEEFGTLIEPTATRMPYHVCIGNHEYDHVTGSSKDPSGSRGLWHPSWGNFGTDSKGECAVPTTKRFHMPDNGNSLFWYSHEYANIHFTWISTEHNCTAGSPMYTWLERDLSSVNRSRTPWLFLMGHRPMYCSGLFEPNDNSLKVQIGQREAYEDLIHKYGVDVFITGHYHSYERTCPLYKESCYGSSGDAQSTIHLMLGMAGAEAADLTWTGAKWSVTHSKDYGYTRLFVANSTHLHLQFVANKDGQVYDDVWIKSNHQWNKNSKAADFKSAIIFTLLMAISSIILQ